MTQLTGFTTKALWPLKKARSGRLLSALLLALLLWQWGSAGWILAKAEFAQWLIAQSWQSALQGEAASEIKPWPWADTYPVARLRMPSHGVDLYVLEGAQGNSLAFGPGHLQGTALPGEGVSVIGGHRDTHFAFLADVTVGEVLQIETRAGAVVSYRISRMAVADSRNTSLPLPAAETGSLLLVTCYPFHALAAGGPLRLLVVAEPVRAQDVALARKSPPTHSFSL